MTDLPDLPPAPQWRTHVDRLAPIAASVIIGALVTLIPGWWRDPDLEPSLVMIVTFMTLTSGGVVATFYSLIRARDRRQTEHMGVQTASLRAEIRASAEEAQRQSAARAAGVERADAEMRLVKQQLDLIHDALRSVIAHAEAQPGRLPDLADVEKLVEVIQQRVADGFVDRMHGTADAKVVQLRPRSGHTNDT